MTEDKQAYLAYVIFNLMDGHDFKPIGVFPTLESARQGLKTFMLYNEDEDLSEEVKHPYTEFYTDDYDRSYNITPITIYK